MPDPFPQSPPTKYPQRLLLTDGHFLLPGGTYASRLLVEDSRIVAIDPQDGTLPPKTRRITLGQRWYTPGLEDAHLHLFWLGEQLLRQADLTHARTLPDLLQTLSDHARRSRKGWILGRGFDHERLAERQLPTRAALDTLAPDRPVLITRVCGHLGVLNSAALAALPDELRARGNTDTGVFVETALWDAMGEVPPLSDRELEDAALLAMNLARARGFTAVGTILEDNRQFDALRRLADSGRMPLRVVAHPPGHTIRQLAERGLRTGSGDERLRLGFAKFFSDGTFGARTAWLKSPYTDSPPHSPPDSPDTLGQPLLTADAMTSLFRDAQAMGFDIAVHAIGDAALDACLTAIEASHRPGRQRIEHASFCSDADLDRLAAAGIIAVVQPQFATSDTWLDQRLGPQRVRQTYRFASMLRHGVRLALSSDAPVERLDAAACLASAIGGCPWHDERLTPLQALTAYTHGSAIAAKVEKHRGSIAPHMPADFTVFPFDPLQANAQQFSQLTSLETITF